ncbi:MAG: D-alanyl-D-alanine carboxypeptidase [Clostridia bacterium]|nr:D-alanyl-D-alanine carboxypeptidase [Clostridia bacterium]
MKKSIIIFIMLCLFFIVGVSADGINDIALNSRSAYMINIQNGQVMLDKNSDIEMEPASLTKIMTTLLVLENCQDIENSTVTVDDDRLFYEIRRDGGANLALKTGEVFTVKDLLYATMLYSACDAAQLLAYHFGGNSVENFVDMMNTRANEIGAVNTVFKNPHGLDADGHITTAYDMALIAQKALENPRFLQIVSENSYTIPATLLSVKRSFKYRVELVNPFSTNYYPYAIGVKTGFTDRAGRCLVTMAQKDNASYLVVLMGANLDGEPAPIKTYGDAVSLFEYAFNAYSVVDIAEPGEIFAQTRMIFDENNSADIQIKAKDKICLTLPHGITADMTVAEYTYFEDLSLPLMSGDEIGYVKYFYDGKELCKFAVLSATNVYDTIGDGKLVFYKADGFNILTLWKFVFIVGAAVCILGIVCVSRKKKRRAGRKIPSRKRDF